MRYQFRVDINNGSSQLSVEADSLDEATEIANQIVKLYTSEEYVLDFDYSEE
jgi:hypothetical protein